MGCCVSRNSVQVKDGSISSHPNSNNNTTGVHNVSVPTPAVSQVVIRPFDHENADVNLTEADEEHYTPTPPRVSRSELISDFNVFKRIDQHAKSVPDNKFRNSIKELANYLTLPCTTDVEIVRAFYIWICHNISYDVTKTRPNDSESVIRSGLGVCQGYSNVFASLCRVTGVKVKIVKGYSKGASYNPEKPFTFDDETDHAWNAVCIQDEWRFVECTWGSGYVTQGRYARNVKDIYFLMDPLLMINAHFPYMNYNEPNSQNWQLLERPKSLLEFNNNVKLHTEGLEWGVVISPNKALLRVDKITQIEIKATKKQLVEIMASIYYNDTRIQGSFYIEQINSGTFKCTLRPPTTGKYELKFFGKVTNDNETYPGIVTMALEVKSVQNNIHPYPNRSTAYGYNGAAGRGLKASMNYGQIFLKKSGELDVPVEKENGVRLIYTLEHSEITLVDAKNYVFKKSNEDNMVIFRLRLPYNGFYELKIFSKLPEETGTTFPYAASCLVECVKPTDLGQFPLVYDAANQLGCVIIKPQVRNLAENTSVPFEISCQNLVVAEVQSLPDKKKYPLKQEGNLWKGDVQIPSAGQELIIYGNNVSSTLRGLFKFHTV